MMVKLDEFYIIPAIFQMFCPRLDELRHRLIPLYSYDPAEEQDWGHEGDDNEDEELNVSR